MKRCGAQPAAHYQRSRGSNLVAGPRATPHVALLLQKSNSIFCHVIVIFASTCLAVEKTSTFPSHGGVNSDTNFKYEQKLLA